MSNLIRYNGFIAKVEVDTDTNLLCGTVINSSPHVFYGENVGKLKKQFEIVIQEYLKVCEERGIAPRKSYSGELRLRLPPELHAEVAAMATQEGQSINKWITHTVDQAVHA